MSSAAAKYAVAAKSAAEKSAAPAEKSAAAAAAAAEGRGAAAPADKSAAAASKGAAADKSAAAADKSAAHPTWAENGVNDIFCDLCDNMTYIRTTDTGELIRSCNYCSTTQPIDLSKGSVVMSDITYNDEQAKYMHFITPRIHDDPTLPRVDDIECPNPACSKRPGDKNSVLYIKYDAQNLCFIYSCSHCKHFWGPNGSIVA